MNWPPHAFESDSRDDEIPPEQQDLVERLSREIVRRHLAIPALVVLELSLPLNVLSAQAMHFLAPMLGVPERNSKTPGLGTAPPAHQTLAKFLARPGSIAYFCDRIEALEKLRAEETGTDRTE